MGMHAERSLNLNRQNARTPEEEEGIGFAQRGAARQGKRLRALNVECAETAVHVPSIVRKGEPQSSPLFSPSSGVLAFWRLVPSHSSATPKALTVATWRVTIKKYRSAQLW